MRKGTIFKSIRIFCNIINHTGIALAALAAAALLLLAPLTGTDAHAQKSLTIKLDKKSYKAGDTITVTGKAPTKDPMIIKVYNPNGDPYRVDQIMPANDFSYSYRFKVGGKLGVNGEFVVTVAHADSSAEGRFMLTGGKEPVKKPAATMFKVTAKAGKKDVRITVDSEKKGKKSANKVVFEIDKEIGKAKVKAPSGWKVDAKGKTITFTTDKKAIKPGKKVTFTLPVVITTANWSTYDGVAQLEKGTLSVGKK